MITLVLLHAPQTVWAHDWKTIHTGVQYGRIRVDHGNRALTLHVLKINPEQVVIKPIMNRDTLTAKQMARQNGALAVINANFFDIQEKPLGLIVIDGKERHAKKDISWWGVFCLKKGRASVLHSSNYRKDLCEQAVQAGPRLVINGWIPKLKEEVSRKTAVGVTRRNEVIFVVSSENIPITVLAEVFKRPEYLGGLECLNALNLDGGTSSQLYTQTRGLTVGLPNFIAVPVGLGVFAR